MITLPFFVLVFLVVVALFIGIVVGATLKGPLGDGEKKEALPSNPTIPIKPRTYTITFTENQFNVSQPLGDNRFLLDISDWKPLIDPNFKFVKLPVVLPRDLADKKPLDLIDWKPKIDIENDLIKFRNESKKKDRDHNE